MKTRTATLVVAFVAIVLVIVTLFLNGCASRRSLLLHEQQEQEWVGLSERELIDLWGKPTTVQAAEDSLRILTWQVSENDQHLGGYLLMHRFVIQHGNVTHYTFSAINTL